MSLQMVVNVSPVITLTLEKEKKKTEKQNNDICHYTFTRVLLGTISCD